MDKKSIIQWNCRGLKANYNEILILTTLLSPTVFCLQETFLKNTDNINFKNYNHIATENQKASGGSSILVKSNVPHRQIDINSNLQAVAVAGLGGSVGCAVRLETRRSRVQPPPRSATFFRGDWSWNIFYGHSLPSADSRRAVVSFWRKNVHSTG